MNPSESGDITIAGKLVRFLRSGVKQELGASLEMADYIECVVRIVPQRQVAQVEAAPGRSYGPPRRLLKALARSDYVNLERTPLNLKER